MEQKHYTSGELLKLSGGQKFWYLRKKGLWKKGLWKKVITIS